MLEANIPKERLFYYLLLIVLLPSIFALTHLFKIRKEMGNTERLSESLYNKTVSAERRQGLNKVVQKNFSEADHFYLDKNLEGVPLLEEETEMLGRVISQKTFIADEKILARYEKLKNSNKLQFVEGMVQTYPTFQETLETLASPVEVNLEDLKEILSNIEGVDIGPYGPGLGRPQLIITFFKIDKKSGAGENEIFELSLRLLKREYL